MAELRKKRPRDTNQLAKLVADIATGAVEDREEDRDAGKNPHAVALGRLGGQKGGAASKKIENHAWAVAMHFCYYNFVKIHSAHRMSPAMAAGVAKRLWEMSDIVAMVEAAEPKPGPRGPYGKRSASAPAGT